VTWFKQNTTTWLILLDINGMWLIIVKGKESRNRPDVAQRVPGGLGSQSSMTFDT